MKYLKTYNKIFEKIITALDYSRCNLTELPELPDTLEVLYCQNNNLTELPKLPESIEILVCANNNLTSLPELPDTLLTLYCANNNLTSLPELPESLEILECEDNNLPYDDLEGYKKWYAKTYPERIEAKKYNL